MIFARSKKDETVTYFQSVGDLPFLVSRSVHAESLIKMLAFRRGPDESGG
jgi:hypothetical protein